DHPNIVSVYEAGEAGNVCYIASAYCPGPTLADWLRMQAEPVPAREAAGLMSSLADAGGHAHSRGGVHRDLGPAKSLPPWSREPLASALPTDALARGSRLNDTVPKVTDFGLAKVEAGASSAGPPTQSGAFLGTPAYMAPEQAAGKVRAVGPAAD